MNRFHYLVRGICKIDGHVLLAHEIGANNTFLPGGHIELGEGAVECLRRELAEELGVLEVVVEGFVGAVEAAWEVSGAKQYEINLIFEVRLAGIAPPVPPESQEAHLEFLWARLDDLQHHNLQPVPLVDCIRRSPGEREPFWGSTL